MQKSPVQLDKLLIRYLGDIEFMYDEHNAPDVEWNNGLEPKNRVLVTRFSDSELSKITHKTEARFEKFKEYFESKKILRFFYYEEYLEKHKLSKERAMLAVTLQDPYETLWYEATLYIEVLDIDALRKFREKYTHTFDSETLQKLADDNHRMLYMNPNGQFFYGKNRDEVSVKMDMDADYYKLLVCIYLSTNGGGQTTVVKINERMRTEYGEKIHLLKSMQNALTTLGQKYITRALPGGGNMFEWKNDKLNFQNPIITQPEI